MKQGVIQVPGLQKTRVIPVAVVVAVFAVIHIAAVIVSKFAIVVLILVF